jgi:putative endonuclease
MTPPPVPQDDVVSMAGKACVDVLRSLKDGGFYLGSMTDLQRRLDRHHTSPVSATEQRRPFELMYYETFSEIGDAGHREYALKHNPNMFFHLKKRTLSKRAPLGAEQVVG